MLCSSFAARPPDAGDARSVIRAEVAFTPFAYGSHPRQRLLAFWHGNGHARRLASGTQPPGDPAERHRTGVLVLHGGYWHDDRSPRWNTWSGRFAEAGYAVFDVEYRRNVDARWPAQRDDVQSALRWIRQRSGHFGIDPARLYVVGSSAGGHLATNSGTYGGVSTPAKVTAATRGGPEPVAGVVGISPVNDPLTAWRDGGRKRGREHKKLRANAQLLAGCAPTPRAAPACRATWRDMNAATHASGAGDPRMLLLHSRWDFVPPSQSRALARAEQTKGAGRDAVSVVTVPGGKHGGALLDMPGVFTRVLNWLAR